MYGKLPDVSIIVIGLNEADNLDSTFIAINKIDYPKENFELIYVDSASVDDSVKIARKYTNKIFIEKKIWPTAANARNRGLIEAKYDLVHFIDGDIQIDKAYLKKAVIKLQNKNIHSVYGYLTERSMKGVNKILLNHWESKKEGFSNASGAGGTYKREALLKSNGYDERIARGEETELGDRFRRAGFKIWYLNSPMGVHHYGVDDFFDLAKTYYFDGKSKSHLLLLKEETEFYKKSNKIAWNNLIFCFAFIVFFMVSVFFVSHFFIVMLVLLFYGYFFVKYIMVKQIYTKQRLIYFFLMHNFKFVSFIGQIVFLSKCFFNPFYRKSVITPKAKLF